MDPEFKATLGKGSKILFQKQNINKRIRDMAQVEEHVPASFRPWVQAPILQKKKKKKKKIL
jgi:hypothetical protein